MKTKTAIPVEARDTQYYSKDWQNIRLRVFLECDNKCESCGAVNFSRRGKKAIRLVIVHMDGARENCRMENLKALCRLCLDTYKTINRDETRLMENQAGTMTLFKE